MIKQILKQINDYKLKNNKYPKFIYIKEKQYRRLKKELSIVEEMTENIKIIYFMEFKII